jgi:serine/threonine-protein kinase
MAGLSHPGIVRVILQEAEDHGFFFLVMEYVDGGDLRKAVREKRIREHAALSVVLETAMAVEHAHQHGLIHRDVKPANILLDEGHSKLTDFDLVWAADTTGGTRTGTLGTMIYAAPEAAVSSAPSISMDIYGLGMCAIFALYGDDLPLKVMRDTAKFIEALPCATSIKHVLVRAVELDPVDRFGTVADFSKALATALGEAPRA